MYYLALLIILLQISCRSAKDMTMFQDLEYARAQYSMPKEAEEHKIQPYDNLYLSVLTLDPEVNKVFDPSLGGEGIASGTQQMFGTTTSQYLNGYRVSTEGTVILPYLGEIVLAGLTLKEAENSLKERAEVYLKKPTVQVKLLNYKINILGEVRDPGIYYNYEGSINILDAIGMAKGITDFADLNNVLIKRFEGDRINTHKVNLTDNSIFSSELYHLQPNDLVYIPPTNLKRNRDNATTYSQVLGTLSILLVGLTLILR